MPAAAIRPPDLLGTTIVSTYHYPRHTFAQKVVMIKLANQFSFLLLFIPIVALALFFLLRGKGSRLKQILSIMLVGAVTIAFFWLQPGKNEISVEKSTQLLETATTPVFLEVFSDF